MIMLNDKNIEKNNSIQHEQIDMIHDVTNYKCWQQFQYMNRNRPYLNRFVKQKQLELTDIYHDINMREIKPITTRLMDNLDAPIINNSKREMIRQVRDFQIERENKLLLGKIQRVMLTKGNYSVSRTKSINTKANKSLNDIVRRKQIQNIQNQNKRFLLRLQSRKATMDLNKLRKDWQDNKSVIKRMANHQFNLTQFKSKDSRLRSFTSDRLFRQNIQETKINRMKVIDGQRLVIRVQFSDRLLKIVGDCRDHRDLKVIQIPKEEGLMFIQKDCDGKMDKLLEKLKYDKGTQTLYLVSQNIQESGINPEKERNKSLMLAKNHTTIDYSPKIQNIIHYQTLSHRNSAPETQHPGSQSLRIPKKTKKSKKSANELLPALDQSQRAKAQQEKIAQTQKQQLQQQSKLPSHEALHTHQVGVIQSQENYNQQFQQSKQKANVQNQKIKSP